MQKFRFKTEKELIAEFGHDFKSRVKGTIANPMSKYFGEIFDRKHQDKAAESYSKNLEFCIYDKEAKRDWIITKDMIIPVNNEIYTYKRKKVTLNEFF